MLYFLLCLFLLTSISSEDHSVQVDGAISVTRFLVLSENTLGGVADDVTDTGSTKYILGSIEVNLQNTDTAGGLVYLTNNEFDTANTIFRVVGIDDVNNQIKIAVDSDTNITTGAPATVSITAANPALFRNTSAVSDNERIVLSFYAQDDTGNTSGSMFQGHFLFYWTDHP